jgi:hypothetical protein
MPRRPLVACLTLAGLALSGLALTGCGGGKPHATPHPSASVATSPTPSVTSPAPHFTTDQVLHRLISAKDVGPSFKQVQVGTRALIDRKALMCSLTGVKLPGSPKIGERQYSTSIKVHYDRNYNQFIALYDTEAQAVQAFSALRTAAQACAPKRHVPPSPDPLTTAQLLSHNDKWDLSPPETVQGWAHLHAWEEQVSGLDPHKYNNVYYDAYDFLQKGNLVLATLYDEQSNSLTPGDPVKRRAAAVLTKQITKLDS